MKVNLNKIKGLMAEHGDTQLDLAEKLGISENTLRHYFHQKTEMRVSMVGQIAEIYHVKPLDLLQTESV